MIRAAACFALAVISLTAQARRGRGIRAGRLSPRGLSRADARHPARRQGHRTRKRQSGSGAADRRPLSTCCRGRRDRGICRREPLWRDKPRSNIPGSIWLPDTGYGELAPSMADYFAKGLEKATHGDRARLLVVYCLADCWMSWNAAKRALALGYSNVAWYPEGTDGWRAPLCRWKMRRRSRVRANRSVQIGATSEIVIYRTSRRSRRPGSPFPNQTTASRSGPARRTHRMSISAGPRKCVSATQADWRVHRSALDRRWPCPAFPATSGFRRVFLGHRLLLARKALDPVHHLVALALSVSIQRGEKRLCLLLFFLIGSNHIVRDQFARVLHRRAAGGQARDQFGFLRIDRVLPCRLARSPDRSRRSRSKSRAPSIAGKASPDNADPARGPNAPSTRRRNRDTESKFAH